jgi:hypothetical protein
MTPAGKVPIELPAGCRLDDKAESDPHHNEGVLVGEGVVDLHAAGIHHEYGDHVAPPGNAELPWNFHFRLPSYVSS